VEQSIQQTALLKEMLGRLGSNDLTGAAALIGRRAEFGNSVAALSGEGPAQWRWTLPATPASLAAEIRDSGGRLVATPSVAMDGTTGTLSWDGVTSDGSRAPDGAYSLRLVAKDAGGGALSATVHSLGTVREVTQRGSELWLGLGSKVALPIADLLSIADS